MSRVASVSHGIAVKAGKCLIFLVLFCNDFAMLDQIGGECAGAITFIPAGEPFPEQNYRYKPLSRKRTGARSKRTAAPPFDGW